MKKANWSGSPAHRNSRVGPGEVAGAGEMPAIGPGKSKETRGSMPDESYPSRKTPSGDQKVSNRTRGMEEDGE